MADDFTDTERRLSELAASVYSDDIKTQATAILDSLPNPDDFKGDAPRKVKLLTLRARARLILPAYSKEAETDLSKALKLKPNDLAAWVAMSECMWKRNAVKEARDALHSALGIDANYVPALIQLSRVLRSLCSQADTSVEEQAALLEESVRKAKCAVTLAMDNGAAWSALGVALMQQTVSSGMDLVVLRKALQALTQAARKAATDPDVHFNRGVALRCLGEYGAAHESFRRAHELDPKGLAGAAQDANRCASIIHGFSGFIDALAASEDRMRDFKKQVVAKVPLAEKARRAGEPGREFLPLLTVSKRVSEAKVQWTCVKVIDLISKPSEQPHCFLAADREGTIAAVLTYRLLPSAVKPGDVLFISCPPSSVVETLHTLEAAGDRKAVSLRLPTVTVDPTTLCINGVPVSVNQFKMPMLSTRQFS